MGTTQAGVEFGSVSYQSASGKHHFQYDQGTTSASLAVVAALADVLDADPVDMEPLGATVDADALDALVRPRGRDDPLSVTFEAAGCAVTVDRAGSITVAAPRGPGDEH